MYNKTKDLFLLGMGLFKLHTSPITDSTWHIHKYPAKSDCRFHLYENTHSDETVLLLQIQDFREASRNNHF